LVSVEVSGSVPVMVWGWDDELVGGGVVVTVKPVVCDGGIDGVEEGGAESVAAWVAVGVLGPVREGVGADVSDGV
jgi:hypothetical protein